MVSRHARMPDEIEERAAFRTGYIARTVPARDRQLESMTPSGFE